MSILNNKFTRPPIIRHFVLIIWLFMVLPMTPFVDVTVQDVFKEFSRYFFKWKVNQ